MNDLKIKKNYNTLISGIKDFFRKNSYSKAVLGLSGGLDSAVCAKLLTDALGNNNVTALIMPEKNITSEDNIKDAQEFADSLNIKHEIIWIDSILKQFKKLKWKQTRTALINTKARVRALILYNYSNSNNALVAGTSNKSELLLGYGTKYGDLAADVYIIGDIFKTELKQLAYFLKIPEKIIKKIPSAELEKGQTDEAELGASYEEIDNILKNILLNKPVKEELEIKLKNKIRETEHKRKFPLIIKIK